MNDTNHYELHFQQKYFVNYQEPSGKWYKTQYENIRGPIPRLEYNNGKSKNYIIIDIDKPENLYNFEGLNIPKPNFIVKNKSNGKGHLFYVLDRTIFTTSKTQHFLKMWKTTQKYFNIFLGGDPFYNGYKGKNLNNHFDFDFTEINDKPHTIKDLFSYVEDISEMDKELQIFDETSLLSYIPSLSESEIKDSGYLIETIKVGMRNIYLFDKLRKFSYSEIVKSTNERDFTEIVSNRGYSINSGILVPLPLNEVKSTIKSIIKYCLKNKKKIKKGFKHARGKMKKMDLEGKTLKEKQKLSQKYMCESRIIKTKLKISISILEMEKKGMKINISTISQYTKLNIKTVRKYKDILENRKKTI